MIPYSSVTEKHDKIIILCSGESVTPMVVNFLKKTDVPIIAVNGGIDLYSNSNYWITVDPAIKNFKRMNKNLPNVKYYCAVPEDYGQKNNVSRAHEKPILKHVHYLHREHSSLLGLSDDKKTISSGNSGFGGLNLAYHMNAKYILFLGLDGTGGYSKFGNLSGKPVNLNNMNILFDSVKFQLEDRDIQIVNGSNKSIIKSFPKTNPMNGINWINHI